MEKIVLDGKSDRSLVWIRHQSTTAVLPHQRHGKTLTSLPCTVIDAVRTCPDDEREHKYVPLSGTSHQEEIPMPANARQWSRRRFLATASATAAGTIVTGIAAAPGAVASRLPVKSGAGSVVSSIDTSKTTYDRITIMSGGQPFFHNGIQFRYEKLKYSHGWTNAQLKPIMAMISQDNFTVVNIPIWWSQIETSKDTFSWTDIDLYFDWCVQYGLRLELLWFGSDSDGTSVGQGPRIPSYAADNYQYVVDQNGKIVTNGPQALLDKTDPRLLDREKYVLGHLMNHIAAYDTTNRLLGVQVLNEPNVSTVQGTGIDRSYSSYSNALWTSGHYTDAGQFRRDILLNYQTQLAAVIKQSGHSVYTRSNIIGDARPIAENEALRARSANYMDFYGYDPYTTNDNQLYAYGTDRFWAQGRNLPMMMENFGGSPDSGIQKVNAIAGGAILNYYAAVDPDNPSGSSDQGLYNYDPTTKVVTRKAATYVISALVGALNKIGVDLATRNPVDVGGKTLQVYNRTAAASVNSAKPVGSHTITYASTASGQAFAVQRGSTEFALLSTQTGTFTLPTSIGRVSSVRTGRYDASNAWVDSGSKSYAISGTNVVINLAKDECVRVVFS
jgi:hypothetical protein